jgi:hypothetical protein
LAASPGEWVDPAPRARSPLVPRGGRAYICPMDEALEITGRTRGVLAEFPV